MDHSATALVFAELTTDVDRTLYLWDYADAADPDKPLKLRLGLSTACAMRKEHVDAPRAHEVSLPSHGGRGATCGAVLRVGRIVRRAPPTKRTCCLASPPGRPSGPFAFSVQGPIPSRALVGHSGDHAPTTETPPLKSARPPTHSVVT